MSKFVYDPSFKVDILFEGQFAHWATPGGQVERYTYPYPTMSGLTGGVGSISWKPAIEWVMREIRVLNPVQKVNYTTNELKTAPSRLNKGTTPIDANQNHTQRHNHVLWNVAYVVVVSPCLVGHGVNETPNKYTEMLRRRVKKGQCHHTPYLGKREYRASFKPPTGDETPIDVTENLYNWHIGFDDSEIPRKPRFADLKIENGVIKFSFDHYRAVSKYLKD